MTYKENITAILECYFTGFKEEIIDSACNRILEQERNIGHWNLLDECANSGYYCSECHKKLVKEGWSKTVKKIKFCPNCGAKMVELQESEVNNG